MSRKNTLRILVLNESDNEAERLVSLFRSAGRVVRLHRTRDMSDLQNQLGINEWDVAIANNLHHEISPQQFIDAIKTTTSDLPLVVICDDAPLELFSAGVRDVIRRDDVDGRLVHAVLREAESHEQLRDLQRLQQELNEAQQRSALLLAESNDAIAYVAEGMIINANDMFATRFGYDNAGDLDCIALVDLVSDNDHEKLKAMLKSIAAGGESVEFEFAGVCSGGDNFSANMELSSTSFDGEACIQLVVRDQARGISAAAGNTASSGLLSRNIFSDILLTTTKQAKHGGGNSCLVFLRIDNCASLREKLGFCAARQLLLDLGDFLQQGELKNTAISAYCDDGLAILLKDCSADQAKQQTENLLHTIEQHIFESNDQTQRITASAAIVPIDAQCPDEINDLLDLGYSACENLRDKNGVGNRCDINLPMKRKRAMNLSGNIKETLDNALEDNRFFLTFQPVVSLRGGEGGDHYEVFLRMLNDNDEELVADQFLAEMLAGNPDTRLDRWIIVEATKQLARQRATNHDVRLFINLTSALFNDPALLPWLSVALKAADLPANALIFQFRETDIENNLKAAKAFTSSLHELGAKISITHFGVSADSIKTLKFVDADFVRTDGTFTHDLQNNSGGTTILKTLVSNVHEAKKQAIIPLVENASVLALLWQIGAEYMQGNFLQAPQREMNYEFADIA